MAPSKQPAKTWKDNVIRGQQCIVAGFGLGRVTDFGRETEIGGYDYIAVRFYADPTHPQIRRFAVEAVSLLDPTGLVLKPYKATDGLVKKGKKGHVTTRLSGKAYTSPSEPA